MIRIIPTTIYFYISIILSIYGIVKLCITNKYNGEEVTVQQGYGYVIGYVISILLILWLLGVF